MFLISTFFIQLASRLSPGENHPTKQQLTPSKQSQTRTFHKRQTWDYLGAESVRLWPKNLKHQTGRNRHEMADREAGLNNM